ncbi:MAG: hypothetical protein AAF620_15655 [Bacteroidota bacterium]
MMKEMSLEQMENVEGGGRVCETAVLVGSIAFAVVGLGVLSIAVSVVGYAGCDYSAV